MACWVTGIRSARSPQFLPVTLEQARVCGMRLVAIWTLALVLNSYGPQMNASASSWGTRGGSLPDQRSLPALVQDREPPFV
jgi:hypothetical protein